jgi:cytochrome c-type biogenesis protein CcmH
MIAFWVVAGVLTAAAAGLILSRAAAAAARGEALDPTPAVYRRQMAEIDELADRGLMAEGERKAAKAEAGRRLLAAADTPERAWTADASARSFVLLVVALAAALSLGLYIGVGTPGMGDQPFAKRMNAWRKADPTTLAPQELAAVVQRAVKDRPTDPEGWRYLGIAQAAAQNYGEAVRALHKAVDLAPQREDLWELLGQAQMYLAGGDVTPEVQRSFEEALKRDSKAAAPRFYLAEAKLNGGDRTGALADLKALQVDMPANDPRRSAVASAISEVEGRIAAPAAPTLSADQLTAVRGMVAGLDAKLKANPNNPAGWVQLVRAYAVLGDVAKRDAALASAKTRYAGRAEVLQQLDAAAKTEPMR